MADETAQQKTSEIHIRISLDAANIPEHIQWSADDAEPGNHDAKAMFLGFWDKKQGNGLSIDLWTKEMTVPEMNVFFYQTLLSLSDTLNRATGNAPLKDEMVQLARKFIQDDPASPQKRIKP